MGVWTNALYGLSCMTGTYDKGIIIGLNCSYTPTPLISVS